MPKISEDKLDQRVKQRFSRNNKTNQIVKTATSKINQKGEFYVDVDGVKPSIQTRLTFTSAQIAKRKRSLLAFGQLAPLILIEDEETGELLIEDGELTWKSVKAILKDNPDHKLRKLRAAMSDSKNPKEARSRSLLHHQTYEGLNPLDRAEGVMQELQQRSEYSQEDIIKSLRNITYKLRKDDELKKSIELYLEYNQKKEILVDNLDGLQIMLLEIIDLYQVDLLSYVNSDLAYIHLDLELKKAIRNRNLSPSHALIIQRISLKKIDVDAEKLAELREQVIQQTLDERLSKQQLTKIVQELLANHSKSKEIDRGELKQRSKESYHKIKTEFKSLSIQYLSNRDLNSLKTILEKQLTKIEQKINS